MAYDDGVKSAPIAYIGLVSVIVTFIVVMMLQVLFFGEQDEMVAADQASQGAPAALADLTSRQLTVLTRRELVDRDRGVVSVGISRAMELVVKELAEGKTPAAVVGPPLPTANPAAAPPAAGSETQAPGEVQPPVPADAQPPAASPSTEPAPAQEKKDAVKS